MAHRLLRTLVVSSSLLLEGTAASGCASSHVMPEPDLDAPPPATDAPTRADSGVRDAGRPDTGLRDAGLPDAGLRDAGRADDAGTDAGLARDASDPIDVPDAAILEGDAGLVFCEGGWPTTKAQTCEVDSSGVALCCRPSFHEDAGEAECCIGLPEDRF